MGFSWHSMTEEPGPRWPTLALLRMLRLFNRASHIGSLHVSRLGLAYAILPTSDNDWSYTLRTTLATHDAVRRLNVIRAYSFNSLNYWDKTKSIIYFCAIHWWLPMIPLGKGDGKKGVVERLDLYFQLWRSAIPASHFWPPLVYSKMAHQPSSRRRHTPRGYIINWLSANMGQGAIENLR